jgi:ubiquinone/menaquinone biosynthesis C-methylase UbiE
MSRHYFNEHAGMWDNQSSEKDSRKLERMIKRLGLKRGMAVLDVGTGTGVFLPYLIEQIGIEGLVYALDIAEQMLRKAREKSCSGEIDYLCGDVTTIPLQPATCDAVVCYSSFPHFRNKIKALQEIKRVLKKGGRVFICHTSSRETINRVHSQILALHDDVLPAGQDLAELLLIVGYTDILVEDTPESYFACGRRGD